MITGPSLLTVPLTVGSTIGTLITMRIGKATALCGIVLCLFFVLPTLTLSADGNKKRPGQVITTDDEQSDRSKTNQGKTAFIVNGRPVPERRVTVELFFTVQQLEAQGRQIKQSDLGALREQVVPQTINQELFYQEAEKSGVTVTDTMIDRQMNTILQQFGGKKAYKELLTRWDLSLEECRNAIVRQLVINRFIHRRFSDELTVSEEEIREYYIDNREVFEKPEQRRASHILVKVEKDADEEEVRAAEEKITILEEHIKNGADFAEEARKHSEGPSAQYGGDIGFFKRDQMPEAFDKAAFSLAVGEVSEIVRTDSGFHLIKVTDHRKGSLMPYEEARSTLFNHLKMKKLERVAEDYLKELKADAKIEIVR